MSGFQPSVGGTRYPRRCPGLGYGRAFGAKREDMAVIATRESGRALLDTLPFHKVRERAGHPDCAGTGEERKRWGLGGDFVEEVEEAAGEEGGGGEGEDPGEGDVADGGHLQAALVGGHGAGDSGA